MCVTSRTAVPEVSVEVADHGGVQEHGPALAKLGCLRADVEFAAIEADIADPRLAELRVACLEMAIAVIKSLYQEGPATHSGAHFEVDGFKDALMVRT